MHLPAEKQHERLTERADSLRFILKTRSVARSYVNIIGFIYVGAGTNEISCEH